MYIYSNFSLPDLVSSVGGYANTLKETVSTTVQTTVESTVSVQEGEEASGCEIVMNWCVDSQTWKEAQCLTYFSLFQAILSEFDKEQKKFERERQRQKGNNLRGLSKFPGECHTSSFTNTQLIHSVPSITNFPLSSIPLLSFSHCILYSPYSWIYSSLYTVYTIYIFIYILYIHIFMWFIYSDTTVPPWVGFNEEEQMKAQILELSAVSTW